MKFQFFKHGLLSLCFLFISTITVNSQVINAEGAPYTTTSSGSGTSTPPNQVLKLVQDHFAGGTHFLYTPSTIPHLRLQTLTEGPSVFPSTISTVNRFQWDLLINTEGIFQYLSETPTLQIIDASNNTLLHEWEGGNYKAYGSIFATEVTVTDVTNFPDYVFEENYNLMTLEEVEAFIEANKHLPNVPPASEVAETGLQISEIQLKQMEKIEELFLYLIDLKADLELLKEENEQLKAEIQSLTN